MPPYSPTRTLSESDLQDLLTEQVNEDYLPLFQDLTPGFEFLYSAPASPTLDSSSDTTAYCSPTMEYDQCKQYSNLQIRVLGVPTTGAKSRVETQIKLCIQLMTQDKKVMDWSYIRIDETMLARSRLRKNQHQKSDGSVTTMVSDEAKILQLEAKVVCASNTDQPIRMCVGCVRRERKRAERTKDGKQKHEYVLSDKELEMERDRILLFNCSPMLNFSSGDAILPTRITCYCRHHNEKTGFRICFVMKNIDGLVVGTGISPPIMITDDHKKSEDAVISRPDTPAPSRRNSISTEEDDASLEMTVLCNGEEAWPFNRRRRITLSSDTLDTLPQLDRLVPSQGPTYGGIEVTLLGSGFYQGLTCLFGEHQASTIFWNSSTMVCILPPANHTGPVVVSFKEHTLVLEGQDVAIFTYFDASDQALLELALQVVGLKMTGKLHDAKSVAMRIVQGGEQYQQQNVQQDLVHALQKSSLLNLLVTNKQGQSLLHLAVIVQNEVLVKSLVACCPLDEKAKLLNLQDVNEMTCLHFAIQSKSVDMVRLLLISGANPTLVCRFDLDVLPTIKDILDLYTSNIQRPLSRRPSKSHMMHRFHSITSSTSHHESTPPSMESDGLGFVKQKIDRRLYLFWLPVLICK
ncbi:uncharacterized protein EV154DRAFT_507279 [Mucor mucedo]|uniref:uncharacterized protein n=1 Tax=Mucor mucedo TaxID=29922 RepID=UPI00221FF404|nr:uncharacterized protein EV154DRAFT_507279 [Mucor mucedo]KAI7891597.1 hypothetical protein EV154DRAFT_507279 [Mucor mucedo]